MTVIFMAKKAMDTPFFIFYELLCQPLFFLFVLSCQGGHESILYAMARVQLEGTDLFPPCYAVCMHVVLLYPAYVYWGPHSFSLLWI